MHTVNPKFFVALTMTLLLTANLSRGDTAFEEIFHVAPETIELSLGRERLKLLQNAAEDFSEVLNFKLPSHARLDQEAPVPADGGTNYYKGDGYRLVITKSLFNINSASQAIVHGYMYGPILVLDPKLGGGNGQNISHVSFYPADTLNKMLEKR